MFRCSYVRGEIARTVTYWQVCGHHFAIRLLMKIFSNVDIVLRTILWHFSVWTILLLLLFRFCCLLRYFSLLCLWYSNFEHIHTITDRHHTELKCCVSCSPNRLWTGALVYVNSWCVFTVHWNWNGTRMFYTNQSVYVDDF